MSGRILLARGSGGGSSHTVCSGTGDCRSFSATKSLVVEMTTLGREFGFQEATRGLQLVMGGIQTAQLVGKVGGELKNKTFSLNALSLWYLNASGSSVEGVCQRD